MNSRDWYLANSWLSKRIWKAVQMAGEDANVLFTSTVPKEKPVPMGWSMYITGECIHVRCDSWREGSRRVCGGNVAECLPLAPSSPTSHFTEKAGGPG